MRLRTRLLAAVVGLLLAGPVATSAQEPEAPPGGPSVRVRAQYLRYDRARSVVYARGHVVVEYEDLTLRADEALLELEPLEVAARGNVVLETLGQVVTADQLTYNLRTRFGSLETAETRWRDPLVQDPIHIRAQRMEGNPEQRVCFSQAEVTTCDLDDPGAPYKLAAREIDFIPQDRVVMRDVSLYLFGAKVLTLPFFVLFLREPRQSRILPVVGYSEEEGFFVKVTTTYVLSDEHLGFLYTDWMERIGFGGGFQHLWRYDRGQGDYFLYLLQDRRLPGHDLRVRLQHRHDFGGGLAAGVFFDQFSRYAADGTVTSSLYTSLDGVYRDPLQSANLFASYSRSDNPGGFWSSFLSGLVAYDRRLSPELGGRLQVPFTASSTVDYTDLEAVPRIDLNFVGQGYTLQLVAEQRVDLEGDAYTGDVWFGVSRLPEVLYTGFPQPLRLGDVNLSLQLLGGLGYFVESVFGATGPETVPAVRLDAQAVLSGVHALAPRLSADLRLAARASYYTTGDFRGILTSTFGLTHQWTDALSARLVHNYKDNLGRTPFQFDRDDSRLHNAQLQLTYRSGLVGAELTGGYDFLAAVPSPVTLRVSWLPLPGWELNFGTSLDLTSGQVSSVEAQARARLSEQWEVVYRGVYTPAAGSVFHDTVQVVYYQDCWAAAATYRGTGQVVWLEAWLTAFPQAVGAIGLGQTGILFPQPLLPSPSR